MNIKIAAVTDDGARISSHFGRARFFKVFTIIDGEISAGETVEKPHHASHDHNHTHDHNHQSQPIQLQDQPHHESQGHRFGMHTNMFAPISGCQVLLCGGMGTPAFEKARAAGLEVVLVGGEINEVVRAYLNGEVRSDMRRVHNH